MTAVVETVDQAPRERAMVIAAVAAAVLLLAFGLIVRSAPPTIEGPQLTSMAETAKALDTAGRVMQVHGRRMIAEGLANEDRLLVAGGEHWLRDGRLLVQAGEWLALDPVAPEDRVRSPGEPSIAVGWGELVRTSQWVLREPTTVRAIDAQALRWTGLAMRAEGHNLSEHGKVMAEEVSLMIYRHAVDAQMLADLQQATQLMQDVGTHLSRNGQAIVDYAERIRHVSGHQTRLRRARTR